MAIHGAAVLAAALVPVLPERAVGVLRLGSPARLELIQLQAQALAPGWEPAWASF